MGIQHGHLVLHDGFDKQQTPVRADSVWPLMTLDYMQDLDGGWQPVPKDILLRSFPENDSGDTVLALSLSVITNGIA